MTETETRTDYEPNILNRENLAERKKTFLATAQTTDAIRETVARGEYSHQTSQAVYFLIHETHVYANPSHVYDQEETPRMNTQSGKLLPTSLGDYLQAGKYSTDPVMVGFFECLDPNEAKRVGMALFKLIDRLLLQPDFLATLDIDSKLALLVLVDQLFVLGHFVKNASGRVGEDFMHYLAARMQLSFTISSSGFRGQMTHHALEDEIEGLFWIFRNESKKDIKAKANKLLRLLENIARSAQEKDTQTLSNLLEAFEYNDPSVTPLIEKFREATARKYYPLPSDPSKQLLIATAAAHYALQEVQHYDPESYTADAVREYLLWHIHEMTKIANELTGLDMRYFVALLKQKIAQALRKVGVTDTSDKPGNLLTMSQPRS